ncbi:DUF4325 domain-containing protein [Flavobacterium sp. GNP001]
MSYTIDLELYRTKGAKIFTGRDRGREVRIACKIDLVAEKNDKINIVIPADLFSINPSFFEELFINVVKKYKEDKFYEIFNFVNKGEYPYEKPLKEAIKRILRENTALD